MTVLSKPLANRLFNSSAIANAAIAIIFQYYGDMMKRRRRRIQSAPYPRIRITFQEVFAQLGPVNFRRAFRMTHDSFWRLFYILSPYIDEATQKGNRFQSKGVRGDCYLPPLFPMVPSCKFMPCMQYSVLCWRIALRHHACIWYFVQGSSE